MRTFVYACRQVFKLKANNFINFASLTFGLAVSILLFSRVAFEQSFDNFFPDGDRIYQIWVSSTINQQASEYETIYEPVTAALAQEFPEIESTTHLYRVRQKFKVGEDTYSINIALADSMFFDVLDFGVLRGDPKATLGIKNNMFISEEYARRIFKDKDPVGQTIMLSNNTPITVCGIFRDAPENTHIRIGAVVSLATSNADSQRWGGGDYFCGYVKFRDKSTVLDVESRMMDALQKHHDYKADAVNGHAVKYFLRPITEVYSSSSQVQMMSIIMSILAFIVVFMSAMNYVLLSLSSLAIRAKEVGVHKCNGASSWTIFRMFLYETAMYVLISLTLVVALLLLLQPQIEDMVDVTFATMFSVQNLWAVLVVVAVLFVVAGIIPAKIFSSISVTQIFRRFTENRRLWKCGLLFAQFMGAAFMFSLLLIIINQYNTMTGRNLGYTTENMTYAMVSASMSGRIDVVCQEIARMPEVAGVAVSNSIPIYGLGGVMVEEPETDKQLFTSRIIDVDSTYLDVLNIKLVAGQTIVPGDSSVIVNQTFIESMKWEDNPIGRVIYAGGKQYPVIGVVKDFHVGNLYIAQQPLIIFDKKTDGSAYLNIKLHKLSPESIKAVSDRLNAILPGSSKIDIVSVEQVIKNQYYSVMLFRNGVIIASVILLLIATMGVIGYTSTEIKRRSREIAIRKVMGARAFDVITMLTLNVSTLTIIASVFGVAASYMVGDLWQEMFVVKAPMSWWIFVSGVGFVLLLVVLCTVVRAWRIANKNPVKSIKSE